MFILSEPEDVCNEDYLWLVDQGWKKALRLENFFINNRYIPWMSLWATWPVIKQKRRFRYVAIGVQKMNATVQTDYSRGSRVTATIGLSLVVVIASLAIGCGNDDYRISMEDFMEMQRQFDQQPTTQHKGEPVTASQINKQLGSYQIARSDVLLVTVIAGEQGSEGSTYRARVRRDGTVELPLAGSVQIADMELEDAEEAIKQEYLARAYNEAIVNIMVAEPYTANAIVSGAVSRPGMVPLTSNRRNLLYAIIGAGGVSSQASGIVTLCRLRDPQDKVTLDLSNPEDVARALTLPPLESGDMVAVQAALPNTIYVGGLVNSSSPQSFPQGVQVTVLQAIAGAAGLRSDIFPREATLIRRMPDGKDAHVKLNLNRLLKGEDENIALAAGDILWVPHTIETRIQEWISRNIYFRAGVSADLSYDFIHAKDILKDNGNTNTALLIGGGSP